MDAKCSPYNLLKGSGPPANLGMGNDFLGMTTLDYFEAIYVADQRALLGILNAYCFIEMRVPSWRPTSYLAQDRTPRTIV